MFAISEISETLALRFALDHSTVEVLEELSGLSPSFHHKITAISGAFRARRVPAAQPLFIVAQESAKSSRTDKVHLAVHLSSLATSLPSNKR